MTDVILPRCSKRLQAQVLHDCRNQLSGQPLIDCASAGRPEEMLIVYHAMRRNYVIVVVGPLLSGGGNFCFERTWPPKGSRETAEVCIPACLLS